MSEAQPLPEPEIGESLNEARDQIYGYTCELRHHFYESLVWNAHAFSKEIVRRSIRHYCRRAVTFDKEGWISFILEGVGSLTDIILTISGPEEFAPGFHRVTWDIAGFANSPSTYGFPRNFLEGGSNWVRVHRPVPEEEDPVDPIERVWALREQSYGAELITYW